MSLTSECIAPHIRHLTICGYWKDEKYWRFKKCLFDCYMLVIFLFVITYTFQEFMYCLQVINDMDRVINGLFLFLTHIDTIYKQMVFRFKADKIQKLLHNFDCPIYNQNRPDHVVILQDTARTAKLLLKVYSGAAVATCFLWGVFPFIDRHYEKDVEFFIWLPGVNTSMSPQFELVVTYVWLQTTLQAYSNTSMDAFISTILAICKSQLTILRINLEILTERCLRLSKEKGIAYRRVIRDEFIENLTHYDVVNQMTIDFQDIFGGAILCQFLISGWIICTTMYRITEMDPFTVEFISIIMYLSCILVELFLYCYYGNELTFESNRLMESAYNMDWLILPSDSKKSLIIFMERVKRPFTPTVGKVLPLSMSTFIAILKSSYTFFAVLNETTD